MKKNKRRFKVENKGYALLTAVLAISIFSIMILKARAMWETEIQRDMEQELLFRARQYVTAIQIFRKKNPNMFPQSLDELFEKKCLRKRFLDPMTEEGTWNVVMRSGLPGKDKNALLVVPEDMLANYVRTASIIGVCSSSCEEGFMVYRKKKKYCEWAVYLGEKLDKEMPELKFVADGESGEGERGKKGERDERDERGYRDERDERRERDGRERDGRERERKRERE
jgi:type II secretory pathway pseudopilin PulG